VKRVDGTTLETKAQRAQAVAKTAAAVKKAEAASTPAPASAPQTNKFSPELPNSKPFQIPWKWASVGIGAAVAIVLLVMHSQSHEEKPEAQNVAEIAPPVKQEVAAVEPAPKPVEEAKPAAIAPTNAAPAVAVQPVPPPATNALASAPPKTALDKLKLQGIFYNTQHPSAMINGQVASVDDEVAKCRILEISPSSVTLEYLNERKTLTLR
jgi:hypothetical protein